MAPGPETRSPGQLARERIEALFDRRDFEEVRTLWTEETVDHILPLGFDLRGPDDLEAHYRELFAAVPDYAMTIENVVEDDRHAIIQWTGTGTFDGGSFKGIEPTGKPLSLRGCDVIRFSGGGKIEENTVYYDGAEFFRQIGMLPPRGSVVDNGITQAFNAVTQLRRKLGS
jgi:steroid delta-isomerase-like uncharacterized protein